VARPARSPRMSPTASPWNQNLDQATVEGLALGGSAGAVGVGVSAASDSLSGADATATDGTVAYNSASNDRTLATTTDASDSTTTAACAGGLSFSADTLVQTPIGEQPIASLQVGEHVTSYDPATGRSCPAIGDGRARRGCASSVARWRQSALD